MAENPLSIRIPGMRNHLRNGFKPVGARTIQDQAQRTSHALLKNILNPAPVEEPPATLPHEATIPTPISLLDHLSEHQKFDLLEISGRAFGLGYSKRQINELIQTLSGRPDQIEGALATIVGRMLKPIR